MGKQQAQTLHIGPVFSHVTGRQRRQVALPRGGGIELLLAKLHVVGQDAQLLHHYLFIALELSIRRKLRRSTRNTSSRSMGMRSSLLHLVCGFFSEASARSLSEDREAGAEGSGEEPGLPPALPPPPRRRWSCSRKYRFSA